MNKDDFVILVVVACIVFGMYTLGFISGKEAEQKKAIEAGVAEYAINAKTGERKFVYKN